MAGRVGLSMETGPAPSAAPDQERTASTPRYHRLTVACGFAGSAILALGTLVSSLAYRGSAGESYSPLNHFVSELGQLSVSRLAIAFNGGLFLGGLLLAIFLVGLGSFLGTPMARIAGAMGMLAGLSCSVLGFTPMDYIFPHIAAGDSFFFCGFVSIALFSGAIALDRKRRLARWLVLPGMLTTASFGLFLFLLATIRLPQDEALFPAGVSRPRVMPLPMVEWALYVTILTWLACTSLEVARRLRSAHRSWNCGRRFERSPFEHGQPGAPAAHGTGAPRRVGHPRCVRQPLCPSGDKGLVCVDAGWRPAAVKRGFQRLGFDPARVKAVLLTHSDGDHVGRPFRVPGGEGHRRTRGEGTLGRTDLPMVGPLPQPDREASLGMGVRWGPVGSGRSFSARGGGAGPHARLPLLPL